MLPRLNLVSIKFLLFEHADIFLCNCDHACTQLSKPCEIPFY